jgi:hypothetical protein
VKTQESGIEVKMAYEINELKSEYSFST